MVEIRKIVFAGGPGTGKSETIRALGRQGWHCLHEISRQIILEAQTEGISQLFLKDPLLFSQKLLKGRIQQYRTAEKLSGEVCFFDRGIPEISAYMEFQNEAVPDRFIEANLEHRYDQVFIFPIWDKIYTSDNERYETLGEAKKIDLFIRKSYKNLGYNLVEVPHAGVEARIDFILNHINYAFSK
ncbi:MAG TPA: ATP-binding protein [Flavobacteriaceae bacterium]|nr:ATP-binding protein [Flavobacteriaceae bacterium]